MKTGISQVLLWRYILERNKMKRVYFIVNPHSGKGKYKQLEDKVGQYLDNTKFQHTIFYTRHRGHAVELVSQAVQEGADIVVAVGGDGTINEVARTLVNTSVIMAIVPVGSGNGLAHHLHIPASLKKSIYIINQTHVETIDTISVNNHICVSMAGIGFDAIVAEQFDHTHKRGFLSYLKFILKTYFVFKPHHYIIQSPQIGSKEVKVLMISIANSSQWGYNVKISAKASLQDGKVDICAVKKPPFLTLLGRVCLLLAGQLDKLKWAEQIYKVQECVLYEKNKALQSCHIDGDPIERQETIHVKVLPDSLHIITPRII